MSKFLTIIFSFLLTVSLSAQDVFERSSTIPTIQYETGGGGFGGIVAGVDFDNDGLPEIYTCNTNMIDRDDELIPKIRKFEWNPATASWDSVWGAVPGIPLQNTWPAFTWGDLDGDGKPEIIWSPSNFLDATTNPNPWRVIVYEVVGDGSDNLGVDDGFGGFSPNATFTITDENNFDLRPVKSLVMDIDSDGTDELIFADRSSNAAGYSFGVLSVDDIPNQGGGTETWTVEGSGLGDFTLAGTGPKWDIAVIGNVLYLFAQSGLVYPVKLDGGVWTPLPAQTTVANGSFKGSAVYDIDNNGTDEIFVASWFAPPKIYVCEQVGDTLQSFEIADLTSMGAGRFLAVASGDLDNDGNVDFVIGTRGDPPSVPNNAVFRVEYQGGDITDSTSYEYSVIDSFLVPEPDGLGGDLDVVYVANVDGDAADEVIYTQGYTRGIANDTTADVAILDDLNALESLVTVDGQKDDFYSTLQGPDDGYLQMRSYAGNDNGFPDNDADLSAKVWTGWDDQWFYLYAEVMDDTITGGTTANVWETDNMELKFDPEPTDSVTNSIWDTRLTAPGVSPGDSLNGITDAASKQFGRRLIPGGYALELGIKWTAIGTTESITPAVDNVFGLAINFHDNDGTARNASIEWAAVMLDAVWNTPKYLGTVKFLADNKLQFIPTNNITGVHNVIPYDGRDTTVGVEQTPGIPTEFSLSQNYPNPFNPVTNISFALAKTEYTVLNIYTILGEKVATLVSDELPAGYYNINFDASALASGAYIYRLTAGENVLSKKMILMK